MIKRLKCWAQHVIVLIT